MSALQAALLSESPAPAFVLRDYQEACIEAILAARHRGIQRQLVVLPVGAGKTVVFSHLTHRLGIRTLVLAHREELIEQAAGKLRAVLRDSHTVGIIKAERNEIHAAVLVGSIQTVSIARRLRQLPRDLGLIVVDECHHSLAASYRRTLEQLGCWQSGGPLLVGVTATPDRGDGGGIGDRIFEELVFDRTMIDLITAGYLCDVKAIAVHVAADLARVHTRNGDLDAGELAAALQHANAPAHVLKAYQEHGEGRKALAFTPSVAMAYELADVFRSAGIPAEAIDGTTHPELRRATLRRLASGETRMVANCAVLTEGFDEPSVACILMCRPTKSRALFTQILGRGMRPSPGKQDCLILDLCGNAGRHDVASVPNVFGLPEKTDVASVVQAVAEQRELTARTARLRQAEEARGRLVAQMVQLFRRRSAGPTCHWLPVQVLGPDGPRDLLVLNIGRGIVKVGQTAPDTWAVVAEPEGAKARVIGRDLSSAGAQRCAEAYAARYGKRWAYILGAEWRSTPCSQKMRVFARMRHGLGVPAGATAGEASDLITRHLAAQRAR